MKTVILNMNNGEVAQFDLEAYFDGGLDPEQLAGEMEDIIKHSRVIPVTVNRRPRLANGAAISTIIPQED